MIAVVPVDAIPLQAKLGCEAVERGTTSPQQFDPPALIVAADLATGLAFWRHTERFSIAETQCSAHCVLIRNTENANMQGNSAIWLILSIDRTTDDREWQPAFLA
jgi:hypothetical protein